MLFSLHAFGTSGRTFYVDSASGDDQKAGTSESAAWKTLAKASAETYQPGDHLLLKKGCTFSDPLLLKGSGAEDSPIAIDAYGSGEMPKIDSTGQYVISLEHCNYIDVNNLEITSDGKKCMTAIFFTNAKQDTSHHLHLKNLYIHDIFSQPKASAGQPQQTKGSGNAIRIQPMGKLDDVRIENCRLERIAEIGMSIYGDRTIGPPMISNVQVLDNQLEDIGGPGIQPTSVAHMVVRGNVTDKTGSSLDPRMRARGSGIWPNCSEDILIEKNSFLHARGVGDSCGAHIDFNCKDVIIQYNLSVDNEGGFVEILGRDYNCCYRYNISVNDGARTKGVNQAMMDGKTLWLSCFTKIGQREGPFNSYIYNNTIYVKDSIVSKYSITRATDGALVANNIFYILGKTESVGDDQDLKRLPEGTLAKNVMVENNLYLRADTLPKNLPAQQGGPIADKKPLVGDPKFKKPGGFDPADYIPTNVEVVKDKGTVIQPLPGDKVGVKQGLQVKSDFFGNPIEGAPDLGAVEVE